MGRPAEGFTFEGKDDLVRILHHGRLAATLRGGRAADFLARVGTSDEQLLMARVTGNYKRGNERQVNPRRR